MHIDESEAQTFHKSLIKNFEDAVRSCMHDHTGVAFSGGIDSSLIASIAKSFNPDIELCTVGMHGSYDIKHARRAAALLGLEDRLRIYECTGADIESAIPRAIGAIESTNPVAVGIGVCMYLVSQCAHTNGIRFLVTGQGADELFAGYKRYEQAFDDGILDHELEKDVLALPAQIKRDVAVAQLNHVELYMPMLDLADIAARIDVKLKMRKEGSNYIRKYILRRVSEDYLPAELVWAPKKAVQYGTGIQNALRRMARKRGLGQEDLLRQYSPDKLV